MSNGQVEHFLCNGSILQYANNILHNLLLPEPKVLIIQLGGNRSALDYCGFIWVWDYDNILLKNPSKFRLIKDIPLIKSYINVKGCFLAISRDKKLWIGEENFMHEYSSLENVISVCADSYRIILALCENGDVYKHEKKIQTKKQLTYAIYETPFTDIVNFEKMQFFDSSVKIIDICCTCAGSFLLLSNKGKVFAFGVNNNGLLGLGHLISINLPTQIYYLPKIKKIYFLTDDTSLFVDINNFIWFAGKDPLNKASDYKKLPKKLFENNDKEIFSVADNLIKFSSGEFFAFYPSKKSDLSLDKSIYAAQLFEIPEEIYYLNSSEQVSVSFVRF